MKFPYLKSIGKKDGWYTVGPLARLNTCDFIPTPLAQKEFEIYRAYTNGKPNNMSMHMHWARLIENLHAAEMIKELLLDKDLQGKNLVTKGKKQLEGVGLIEAPRGTLFHHYKINEQDQIVMANLIVSTTNNNEPMNRAVIHVAKSVFTGKTEITEGMMNSVEVAIRAYDPCLSCATHALGQDAARGVPVRLEGRPGRQQAEVGAAMGGILVYGYGNPGRQDDGLGPALVGMLERERIPGVVTDCNYQLQIEDAVAVSESDAVIFVDASCAGGEPFTFGELEPSNEITFTTHTMSPARCWRCPTSCTAGRRGRISWRSGDTNGSLSRACRRPLPATWMRRSGLSGRGSTRSCPGSGRKRYSEGSASRN